MILFQVGTLVKILHGTKGETLLDVVWHPLRPIICSISSGVVSVWAQAQVENWSAFAPDFKEMDENVDYEERESEFDLDDEDRSPSRLAQMEKDKKEEDVDVDVTTCYPTSCYISSDEDDEDVEKKDLVYLPVTLEIEEPESSADPVMLMPGGLPPLPSTSSSKDVKTIDINLDPPKEEVVVPIVRQTSRADRSSNIVGSSSGSNNTSRNRSTSGKRSTPGGDPGKRKKSRPGHYDDY